MNTMLFVICMFIGFGTGMMFRDFYEPGRVGKVVSRATEHYLIRELATSKKELKHAEAMVEMYRKSAGPSQSWEGQCTHIEKRINVITKVLDDLKE